MTKMEAVSQASQLLPEFNSPEIITPEGLVRTVSDFCICVKQNQSFNVYVDGELLGESTVNPHGAWLDAANNLPSHVLDHFDMEFSETGIYFTEEETNDRDEENNRGEAFGHNARQTPSQPSETGVGDSRRTLLLRS